MRPSSSDSQSQLTVSLGKERESRSRVLKEDIAKGVRNGENNSGGKIAQEGKREDRGNMMKSGVVDIFTTSC